MLTKNVKKKNTEKICIVHATVQCPAKMSLEVILDGIGIHKIRHSDFSRSIYRSTKTFILLRCGEEKERANRRHRKAC